MNFTLTIWRKHILLFKCNWLYATNLTMSRSWLNYLIVVLHKEMIWCFNKISFHFLAVSLRFTINSTITNEWWLCTERRRTDFGSTNALTSADAGDKKKRSDRSMRSERVMIAVRFLHLNFLLQARQRPRSILICIFEVCRTPPTCTVGMWGILQHPLPDPTKKMLIKKKFQSI